ncbi:MAG: hypothetical protein ABJ327_00870 [Litoreibacter sp.]
MNDNQDLAKLEEHIEHLISFLKDIDFRAISDNHENLMELNMKIGNIFCNSFLRDEIALTHLAEVNGVKISELR